MSSLTVKVSPEKHFVGCRRFLLNEFPVKCFDSSFLLLTLPIGLLYHFVVEGNIIKDGSKISPDGGLGNITSIAWKSETMVSVAFELVLLPPSTAFSGW